MPEYNGVMMQYFHWYTSDEGVLWKQLKENAESLAKAGITALWLPPAFKGAGGPKDPGYGVYDLFDLGEFDQKGTVRTKYGTHDEYIAAIQAAQKANIQVYADVVFNHKMGADHAEEFMATPINPANRNEAIGEQQKVKCWTNFTFPARQGKYSEMQWHWWHFNATDFNLNDPDKQAVYLFEGGKFDENVDQEFGNFDYLMGCNLDTHNDEVRGELFYWGKWYLETTGVDGIRFDAVKHVNSRFFFEWLQEMQKIAKKKLFAVGEYWSHEVSALKNFIDTTQGAIMLFDAVLHYKFATASQQGKDYPLNTIFDNTLLKEAPQLAVTIVSNHDTQPLQALESVVEAWFKPLAYAMILLRRDGYPCIFAADYYGAEYSDTGMDGKTYNIVMPSHQWIIDQFLMVRREFAYGDQYDYLDHPNCIGWTRTGDEKHPGGAAVLMSNGDNGTKRMQTTAINTAYIDLTKHIDDTITTDEDGWAEFKCLAGKVSVWVPKKK
ncbi:MAG TPA: alpha-amylase [Bacteroidales bacterium]|nr:alpha-amylase [Bacteroidales bacterium]